MKSIKEDVRELLMTYPQYRDDDSKLISAFYYLKYGGKEAFESATAFEFLKDFANGRFPFPDSITRVRRNTRTRRRSCSSVSAKTSSTRETTQRKNVKSPEKIFLTWNSSTI